ncbi:MAG: TetR/AcrR family transcriptional regulator [Propionicimonas sp.]
MDRAARRAQVAGAAIRVFRERGVGGTAVSDIVKAAGIAQGTFYLYFDSKDEVLLAVAEQFVADVGIAVEASIAGPEVPAPVRLRGLVAALGDLASNPANESMTVLLHRPENQALHDRLTEPLGQRLFVLVEDIVAQGVAEGSMIGVDDVGGAAWFVLGGLQSIERAGTQVAEMPAALEQALTLALRALGVPETP